ncbi:hypothetical protein AAF712_016758, partial [Marasmius tenuissimus]
KPLPTDLSEWPSLDNNPKPTYQEYNPHHWMTQISPEEPDMLNFKGPAQMGPLPYVLIADNILILNMKADKVNQIRMSVGTGKEIFFVTPIGSSYTSNKANLETKGPAYKKAMKNPRSQNEDNQSPYSHPWFMLGQGFGPDTLHLGYITGPDDMILRIICFEDLDNHEPWTYINFKLGDITQEEAPKVLTAIKSAVVINCSFRNFVIRNYPDYNPNASLEQRQGWILEALMEHPLTEGRGRQKVMIDLLRKTKVIYDYFPLEEYTGVLACVWCKATTHVSAKCPLLDYPGWIGPMREELEQMGVLKTKKGGPKLKGPTSKEGSSKAKPFSGEKKSLKRKF